MIKFCMLLIFILFNLSVPIINNAFVKPTFKLIFDNVKHFVDYSVNIFNTYPFDVAYDFSSVSSSLTVLYFLLLVLIKHVLVIFLIVLASACSKYLRKILFDEFIAYVSIVKLSLKSIKLAFDEKFVNSDFIVTGSSFMEFKFILLLIDEILLTPVYLVKYSLNNSVNFLKIYVIQAILLGFIFPFSVGYAIVLLHILWVFLVFTLYIKNFMGVLLLMYNSMTRDPLCCSSFKQFSKLAVRQTFFFKFDYASISQNFIFIVHCVVAALFIIAVAAMFIILTLLFIKFYYFVRSFYNYKSVKLRWYLVRQAQLLKKSKSRVINKKKK